MIVKRYEFPGLFKITLPTFPDTRGHFCVTYNQEELSQHGIPTFVQDNESFSKKGVLRGLHFQKAPYAQGKLVRIVSGKVLDVGVDLRPDSPTFQKVFTIVLDSKLPVTLVYFPEGFAHGFLALEDTIFSYKVTKPYHKPFESGIKWNDPTLDIKWGPGTFTISDKDKKLPGL